MSEQQHFGVMDFVPQEQAIEEERGHRPFSVGFLKRNALTNFLTIPPSTVRQLIAHHVDVNVEREMGGNLFPDLDYADEGATLFNQSDTVIDLSHIVVQLAPFSLDELNTLKEKQIILSAVNDNEITLEEVTILREKKITALSLNWMETADGKPLLQDLLQRGALTRPNEALGELILSLIFPIIRNQNLRLAVQMSPILLNAIYCYKGRLTRAEVARRLNLGYEDLFMLCWDWN